LAASVVEKTVDCVTEDEGIVDENGAHR